MTQVPLTEFKRLRDLYYEARRRGLTDKQDHQWKSVLRVAFAGLSYSDKIEAKPYAIGVAGNQFYPSTDAYRIVAGQQAARGTQFYPSIDAYRIVAGASGRKLLTRPSSRGGSLVSMDGGRTWARAA